MSLAEPDVMVERVLANRYRIERHLGRGATGDVYKARHHKVPRAFAVANWDEAEQVRFWDAVDLAGVNGYYPLEPDPVRGAEAVARRLSNLALLAERDLLVLEVGYRSSPLSHLRPWEWPDHVEPIVDETAQANAYAAVLAEWLPAPHVRGLLFWVVPTDPDDPAAEPPHRFCPLGKAAEGVIQQAFSKGAGLWSPSRSCCWPRFRI